LPARRGSLRCFALDLGDAILAFLGDQLDKRRAYRLDLAREQTRRAEIQQRREALIWRELGHERDGLG